MKKKPQTPQKNSSASSKKFPDQKGKIKPFDRKGKELSAHKKKDNQKKENHKKKEGAKSIETPAKPVKKLTGGALPDGGKKYFPEEYIYGHHAVMSILKNPKRVCHLIVVTQDKITPEIEAFADEKDARLVTVSPEALSSLLPLGAVHQGLAVITDDLPEISEDELLSGTHKRIMILDGVTDPHNVGAIMRSCAAFGCYVLIMQDRHAPSLTGFLSKSAASALESVSVMRVNNLNRIMEKLKENGYYIYGADGQADVSLEKVKFSEKSVIVMGSEGEGMRRLVRENCDVLICIPMSDKMESLNVSVATGIILAQSFF